MGVIPSIVMTYVVIELVTEYHDWSCSIIFLYVSTQLFFLIKLTQLGTLLQLDLISFCLDT